MTFETPVLDLELATTAELVTAAQEGDNDAFGVLVNRFERMVQAVCWQRLRNHAEAQEASQEAARRKSIEKELEWVRQGTKGRQSKGKARLHALKS